MAGLMNISHCKFVIVLASISGFVQGLIWAIMCLIAIIWHLISTYESHIVLTADSFESILDSYLYESFIRDRDRTEGLFIQPTMFFILMFVYLLIHIYWMVISIFLYLGTRRNYEERIRITIDGGWIGAAFLVIVLDVVMFALLVHDYKFCIDAYNETTYDLKLPYLYSIITYGIMMTLAARGFVLWCFNVAITGIIIQNFYKIINKEPKTNEDIYDTVETATPQTLPDEAINTYLDEIPRRRRTEPPAYKTKYGIRPFRVYTNINYIYDPKIEERLAKYQVVQF